MLHVKPRPSAHEHRPARNADRSAVTAETVIVPEAEPLRDQAVEVRRLDVRIAPGADRVGPLVIREEKEKIGARGSGSSQLKGGAAPEQKENPAEVHPERKAQI